MDLENYVDQREEKILSTANDAQKVTEALRKIKEKRKNNKANRWK